MSENRIDEHFANIMSTVKALAAERDDLRAANEELVKAVKLAEELLRDISDSVVLGVEGHRAVITGAECLKTILARQAKMKG